MNNPDFTVVIDVPDDRNYSPLLASAMAELVHKGAIHIKIADTIAQEGGTPHNTVRRMMITAWTSLSGSE